MIDFLIIGAQKAATTSLQASVRRHPCVYMPAGESAFFEEPDFAQRPWERFGSDQPTGVLKGIKRPNYLCSNQAIGRISDAIPEARFIVVLREPISRAISGYNHLVRHAHLPARPLDEGMTRCLEAFDAGDEGLAASVVRFGLYGRYLERWYARYPSERFLILSQHAVSDHPEQAIAQCTAHLGIEPDLRTAPGQRIERRNLGLCDPDLLRIARVGSQLKTRPIPGTTRREPRSVLLRGVGTLIGFSADVLACGRGQRIESLTPEIRCRLAAHYAADLSQLKACAPTEAVYWTQ